MSSFRKIENKDEWQNLLSKTFFKTFFHSLNWESFLEDEFSNIKFERYIWRDEALLSMARAKFFGKERLVSHPFCEYGGPLPLNNCGDLEVFVEDFEKEFGGKARLKFHPHILVSAPIPRKVPRQFRAEGIKTFWIEDFSKKSPDDLFKSFRKTLRQEIKKFEQSGVKVGECENVKELNDFYGLYLKTMKRHKNIPLPFSVFAFFYRESNAKIFLAYKDKKVVGGSVFLFYKPFIHYFINSSDANFRDLNIGHGILRYAIKSYATDKYDYLDLGGTRKGSPLEVFKRGWGTSEHSIYEIGASRGGGKLILRNIWQIIPVSVIRKMSPFLLWMKL